MRQFMIRYRFKDGSPEEWHKEVARFIAALQSDPELKGRISYRCLKERDGTGYYHLAAVADDQAGAALQTRAFFTHYTAETKRVAGGEVEVVPLQVIAETPPLA